MNFFNDEPLSQGALNRVEEEERRQKLYDKNKQERKENRTEKEKNKPKKTQKQKEERNQEEMQKSRLGN